MKLDRLNEVYSLTDTSDQGWTSIGQVIKNVDGGLSINFATDNNNEYVGNYMYSYLGDSDDVKINIAYTKNLKESYELYCQNLISQVLNKLA